jgi:hypothetical protein
MHIQSQTSSPVSLPPLAGELAAADLFAQLEANRDKALVFTYEGRDIQPGYHVTEVKSGAFQALDCGANYESWHETFIQLWDIPSEDCRFMPVAKFLAIIGKVTAKVPLDPEAKVTFEVSDGKKAIALYRASSFEVQGDVIRVGLSQQPASCKPRDRWLDTQPTPGACGAQPRSAKSCCG